MKPKCRGHKPDGSPCGRWPIKGALVCPKHGGSAPQVKRKAAQNVAIEKATGLLTQYGDASPVTDPLGELLSIAGRAKRLMSALEARVDQLESIRYENFAGGEQLRAEVGAYMTMLDRCRIVLVDILRLGIEDRLAKVEEAQVSIVMEAMQAALREAGLENRAREVIGNVGRHLQAVPG